MTTSIKGSVFSASVVHISTNLVKRSVSNTEVVTSLLDSEVGQKKEIELSVPAREIMVSLYYVNNTVTVVE